MSEYQYYEFQVLDSRLNREQQEALRRISSRAQISASSFINEYHFGDLKARPVALMADYFDAHVYIANWGSAVFMLKIPRIVVAEDILQRCTVKYIFEYHDAGDNWILEWSLPENENYDRFATETGDEWMARLQPIREEILKGDFRSLYIGWLCAASANEISLDEKEPLGLSGLAQLTDAQMALVAFLEVDQDLVVAAGIGSVERQNDEADAENIEKYIHQLPSSQVDSILTLMLTGSATMAQTRLKQAWLQWQHNNTEQETLPQRSLDEIKQQLEHVRQARQARENKAQQRLAKKQQQARKKYLQSIYQKAHRYWDSIKFQVEKSNAKGYEQAVVLLQELKEAYQLQGSDEIFQRKFTTFMQAYQSRRTLLQRLTEQGLI